MDGGALLVREPDAGVAGLDVCDRRADRPVAKVARTIARRRARPCRDLALDPELLGVAEPRLALMGPEDESD